MDLGARTRTHIFVGHPGGRLGRPAWHPRHFPGEITATSIVLLGAFSGPRPCSGQNHQLLLSPPSIPLLEDEVVGRCHVLIDAALPRQQAWWLRRPLTIVPSKPAQMTTATHLNSSLTHYFLVIATTLTIVTQAREGDADTVSTARQSQFQGRHHRQPHSGVTASALQAEV